MIEAGLSEKTVHRFDCCGRFARLLRSPSQDRHRIQADFCKCRGCRPCQAARGVLIASNLEDFIRLKKVRFITLTLKHKNRPLKSMIKRLRRCFRDLRQTDEWKRHITGYAAFLEAKFSPRTHCWHVHFHMLASGAYWPQKELSTAWLEVTGDSPIVDVRAVEDARGGARYVAKYATKPFDTDAIHFALKFSEAISAMNRTRLWEIGGNWKGKLHLLAKPPDPHDWIDLGFIDGLLITARWNPRDPQHALRNVFGLEAADELPYDKPP